MDKFLPYAKFVVAILGAGVTSALSIADPGTDLFKYLTIASAVLTAVAVYAVPNRDANGRHEAV